MSLERLREAMQALEAQGNKKGDNMEEKIEECREGLSKKAMNIGKLIDSQFKFKEDAYATVVRSDEEADDDPVKEVYILSDKAYHGYEESMIKATMYEYLFEHIATLTVSVERILKSGDRTIVFWSDDTKTVVKRCAADEDSEYAAFAAALAKKCFENNSQIRKMLKAMTEYQKRDKKGKKTDDDE